MGVAIGVAIGVAVGVAIGVAIGVARSVAIGDALPQGVACLPQYICNVCKSATDMYPEP